MAESYKVYASKEYVDSKIAQPDWSRNDPEASDYIENRTHYTEPFSMTFDGDIEGKETITYDGFSYVKISDTVLKKQDLIDATALTYYNGSTSRITITENGIFDYDDSCVIVNTIVLSFSSDNSEFGATIGTYLFYLSSGSNLLYISGIEGEIAHLLNEKYLGNVVKYTAQSLNDDQKAIARANIGALASDLSELDGILPVINGGTGQTSFEDTTPSTARYRASALVATETTPSVNGVINWQYE